MGVIWCWCVKVRRWYLYPGLSVVYILMSTSMEARGWSLSPWLLFISACMRTRRWSLFPWLLRSSSCSHVLEYEGLGLILISFLSVHVHVSSIHRTSASQGPLFTLPDGCSPTRSRVVVMSLVHEDCGIHGSGAECLRFTVPSSSSCRGKEDKEVHLVFTAGESNRAKQSCMSANLFHACTEKCAQLDF